MPVRNSLTNNPVNTPAKRFTGKNYDFEIWARYFPTVGIEYHVRVINNSPTVELKLSAQCTLFGRINGSRKQNEATKADIFINGNNIRFERLPRNSATSCIAMCGIEQISLINRVEVHYEGFERF